LLSGEGLNRAIFIQVYDIVILNVVVEGEHELFRLTDLLGADRLELRHHGRGVVMRQNVEGPDRKKVSGAQRAVRPFRHVSLRDLFDNGLRHENSFA
jgi:hypothetical protein